MSAPARSRISKRQLYSLWFQGLAPPDMPRARLERFVPHIAADGLACALALAEARLGVTLARVARDFVGIELNPDYCEMARRRIYDDAPLLNVEAVT